MNTKLKLAVLITNMDRGGAETVLNNMIPHLQARYDVELFMFNDIVRFELPKSLPITILQKKAYSSALNLLSLYSLARKYKDLLIQKNIKTSLSFNERANFVSCLAKKTGWIGKVVITENTAVGNYYKPDSVSGKIGRFLLRYTYPFADAIICCSQYVAYDLINNVKVINSNIHTVYNGIDLDNVKKASLEKPIRQLEGFWFIHLGSFYEYKNHDLLVRAFAKMSRETDSKLLLMGKGERAAEINALVKELGVDEAVLNLGFVENSYAMVAQGKAFVLSSNLEGLPTVLVEAMKLGLPIISTDCFSGPREILAPHTDYTQQLTDNSAIECGSLGILTPVGNVEKLAEAMRKMRKDYEEFNHPVKRAERLTEFSIDNTIHKYFELLD